jgi:CRP/FNR family transcriptional regulator, cyclic AMP receptor protein
MPYVPSLVKSDLFRGLDADEVEVFRPAFDKINFKAGESIMREGDAGHALLILVEGKISISKSLTLIDGDDGQNHDKTFITLDSSYKPFFGEMALLLPASLRTAHVTAVTNSQIVKITRENFDSICKTYPHLGYKVMTNIATKLAANLQRENQNVLKLTTAFSLLLEE